MEEDYKPKVLPEFKYYKGEGTIDNNPYPCEDIRFRFWYGECMFANLDTEEIIKGYATDVVEWRKWLKEHKPNQSARFLRENTDSYPLPFISFYSGANGAPMMAMTSFLNINYVFCIAD